MPLFKPFVNILTNYIRRLEEASLKGNVTIAIDTIQEGVNQTMKLLPKLEWNPTLYKLAGSAPAAAAGLIKQMKEGTRDPRDINTALGIFYYKMRAILPKQFVPTRINLQQPNPKGGAFGAKGAKGAKGPMGLKSLRGPK